MCVHDETELFKFLREVTMLQISKITMQNDRAKIVS